MAASVCLAASCTEARVELLVDLRTDFAPEHEFVSVETELRRAGRSAAPIMNESVTTSTDAIAGLRVAEFADLEEGLYRLEVRLLDDNDDVLVSRPVELKLDKSFAVTVLITRDCLDVRCDSPEVQACLAGACVSAECTPETPESCPEPECEAAADCPAPDAMCAEPVCGDGVCFFRDRGLCPAPQYCEPESGCTGEGVIEWTRSYAGDGAGASWSHAVTADDMGRPYVVATISGIVDFGGGGTGIAGEEVDFVVALAQDGSVRWSSYMTTGLPQGGVRDVAYCGDAVYAVGTFRGDPGTGTLTIRSDSTMRGAVRGVGAQDAFVAKFDPDGGHPQELRTFGGATTGAMANAKSIACVPDGTLLLTGWFESELVVPTDGGDDLLVSHGERDVFVVRLDSDGTPIWATSYGAGETDVGRDVAAQGSRRYVAGDFTGLVSFGSISHFSDSRSSGFLLSLGDDRTVLSVSTAIATSNATIDAVALDEGVGHAVAGYFRGSLVFGSAEPIVGRADRLSGFVSIVNAGGERFNYHRLTAESGTPIAPDALTHTPDGSWVLVGGIPAGVDLGFGDGPAPAQSAFVLALDATAEPQWGRLFWTSGDVATITDVAAFENELVVVGHYSDTLRWSIPEGEDLLSGGGIFVMRLLN